MLSSAMDNSGNLKHYIEPYSCPLCCSEGFPSLGLLKQHLIKVTNSLRCPSCLDSFSSLSFLIQHLNFCNVSDDNLKLEKSKFSQPLPTEHEEIEDDDEDGYFCTVCDIKIPDVDEHIQQCHSGQEIILQDDDDGTFGSSDSQNMEPFTDEVSYRRESKNLENGPAAENNAQIFYCQLCDITFDLWSEHLSAYHKRPNIRPPRIMDVSVNELFREIGSDIGSKIYYCTNCNQSVGNVETLASHLNFPNTKRKRCCSDINNSNKIQVDEETEPRDTDSDNF